MEVGLFIAGCLTFPSCHFLSMQSLPFILPGRSKEVYLAVSTRVVSFLQALAATCVGLHVVLTCEDIMTDRYPMVNSYAYFGVSYFYYDLGAMFIETYEAHSSLPFFTVCQKFISKKFLLVLHHVFLPLFGFPVVVFFRRGIGDFFVGCIYMAEMSTPFLSVNAIMGQLKWQESALYKINGFLLAISFFFGRIFLFPLMYWAYARQSKLNLWQVPFRIPLMCNVSCLGLLSLQMVWFVAILKRIGRFLRSYKHSESSAPVFCLNDMQSNTKATKLSNGMSKINDGRHKC